MVESGHGAARALRRYDDAEAAFERIVQIHDEGTRRVRERFFRYAEGDRDSPGDIGHYPYVGITIRPADVSADSRVPYGVLSDSGTYGATLTKPELFRNYYLEQLGRLIANHGRPIAVGISDRPIALPFAVEDSTAGVTAEDMSALQDLFTLPDLAMIEDSVANGTHAPRPGEPKPLSLFSAERVDLSLTRLRHYTDTSPEHFQRFTLFTNYQRYIDEFIEYSIGELEANEDYEAFVEPGDVVSTGVDGEVRVTGERPRHLPQMPAYHLVREGRGGITLINIGVGPSNAKTITDHVAVLRPHCWLMIGHCGGLRHTQRLGDYVLAHAYVREDHVLNQDLPPWGRCPARC